MTMDRNTLPRRLSGEIVNGVSVDLHKKKKRILHVFQSKKSAEASKTSGSLMSYFKSRKQNPSVKKPNARPVDPVNVYNTWSMRGSSEPSLSEQPILFKSRFFRHRSSLGKHKPPPSPAASEPGSTPPAFMDLFDAATSAVSDNNLLDCVERSSGEFFRPSSVCSSSSTLTAPQNQPDSSSSSTPTSQLVGSDSPQTEEKKSDLMKNIFSRLTNLGSEKNSEERRFDTWLGRKATTLPRQTTNGRLCIV